MSWRYGREAGDADADEPEGPGPVAKPSVEETARDLADELGLVDCRGQRRRARADGEVGVAELRGDRAAGQARVAQALRDEHGEPAHLVVQPLAIDEVARESVLRGDRDRLELQLEVARVDPACPVAQHRPDRAGEQRAQLGVAELGEPADRVDARPAQPLLGARPDARQQSHRERREEARLGAGRHQRDPAGLAPVGRDLAHDLRGRDPERARQARLGANGGLDRRGDGARLREVARDRCEVEVALVDPRALDARDDLADRVPHDARVLPVERVPGAEEHRGRAAPQRLGRAHRRVDPEPPRRVVRGRHDSPAVRIAADHERLVAQLRDSRAPRPRRRRRRDRGARGSSRGQSYCWPVIVTPALPPPAIEQPAARQVSYGLVTGRAARGSVRVLVHANGKRLASRPLAGDASRFA